jgi:hypothetical protein
VTSRGAHHASLLSQQKTWFFQSRFLWSITASRCFPTYPVLSAQCYQQCKGEERGRENWEHDILTLTLLSPQDNVVDLNAMHLPPTQAPPPSASLLTLSKRDVTEPGVPEVPPPPSGKNVPLPKAVSEHRSKSFLSTHPKTRNAMGAGLLVGASLVATAAVRAAAHLPKVPQCLRPYFGLDDRSHHPKPPAVARATRLEISKLAQVVHKADDGVKARKRDADTDVRHLVKRSVTPLATPVDNDIVSD